MTAMQFTLSSLPLLCCCSARKSASAVCLTEVNASSASAAISEGFLSCNSDDDDDNNSEQTNPPHLPAMDSEQPTTAPNITATPTSADDPAQSNSAALSAEEFESWTLLDRSPRLSPKNQPKTMDSKRSKVDKDHSPSKEEEVDEGEEEDEEEEEEDESAYDDDAEEDESASSAEEDGVEEQVQVDKSSSKPSGVEQVKSVPKQTKSENVARDADDRAGRKTKKKRVESLKPHDDFSSDGISVISESDASDQARLHFTKGFTNFDQLPSSAQLTPPQSPEQLANINEEDIFKSQRQLRSRSSDGEVDLEPENTLMPWRDMSKVSVVLVGVVLTAMAAVLVGNSKMYQDRVSEFSFQHEQRIADLELENTILKNEMNKLKHLYTRSELDEQVQQAEFEWMQAMDREMQEQSQTEVPVPQQPYSEPEPEPEPSVEQPQQEEPQVRKVPPQEDYVKRHVVWSGDDGQPTLVADEDYVVPEFCLDKNAVQDALYSEYSAKYCDKKRRKVEAKLRKAEYAQKHHKYKDSTDYKKYIYPTEEEIAEYQRQATATPPKVPSLSPFQFDFQKAFETIKEEGAVIVDSLVAILDLDPEPEWVQQPSTKDGYLADDEASSSSTVDSSSSPSTASIQQDSPTTTSQTTVPIRWEDYPSWVRDKYEAQPEMYKKLSNKASLLWEWERKKNQFLTEVGLDTLEEVDRKTEDELRQRKQQYNSKDRRREYQDDRGKERWQQQQQHQQQQHYNKYDDRKGKGKYEEKRHDGKDRPRSDNQRSHERKDHYQKDQQRDWNSKEQHKNGGERHNQQQQPDRAQSHEQQQQQQQSQPRGDQSVSSSGDGGSYAKQDSEESRRHEGYRESSGHGKNYQKDWKESSGDRYYKDRKDNDYKKHRDGKDWNGDRKSSGEKKEHYKNDERKDSHHKNGHNGDRRRDSDEHRSGEGSYLNQYREDDHKKQYKQKEEYNNRNDDRKHQKQQHHNNRRGDDDDDDDDDDHYNKRRHHDNKHHHRDQDYHKSKKDWHDEKHHKQQHKDERWSKHHQQHHEEKKRHDRDSHEKRR